VNRRAESEIQTLSHRMSLLMDKVEDVEDSLRKVLNPPDSSNLNPAPAKTES
jgi:phosphoserine aminotransferase